MPQINKKIGRFNGVKISLGKEVRGWRTKDDGRNKGKDERLKEKGEREENQKSRVTPVKSASLVTYVNFTG